MRDGSRIGHRGHRARLGAALLLVLVSASSHGHVGHEGHEDHGGHDAPAPAAALPAAAAVRRPARVIADARTALVIAAPEAGVLEAPAGGFRRGGQAVRAGEVLGWLRPATPQLLRRDIEARLVDARRDTDIGALQIDRYGITEAQRFDISLPTQTLQILTDYTAARTRRAQFEASLEGRVEIRAPRAGRVLRADADSSRQLSAGEALFAIQTEGAGLAIEVRDTDNGFAAPAAAVALLADGRQVPLSRIGSGFDTVQRAYVALYAPLADSDSLQVNQRLRVQWPAAASIPP